MTVPYHSRRTRLAAVLAACVLAVMAIALAGCGSDSGSSDSGGSGDPIIIGVDASMTGPLAGFGAHEQWSINAVVADYNAKGGVTVDGEQRQVKIVLYDDKSDGNVAHQG